MTPLIAPPTMSRQLHALWFESIAVYMHMKPQLLDAYKLVTYHDADMSAVAFVPRPFRVFQDSRGRQGKMARLPCIIVTFS